MGFCICNGTPLPSRGPFFFSLFLTFFHLYFFFAFQHILGYFWLVSVVHSTSLVAFSYSYYFRVLRTATRLFLYAKEHRASVAVAWPDNGKMSPARTNKSDPSLCRKRRWTKWQSFPGDNKGKIASEFYLEYNYQELIQTILRYTR